MGMQESLKWLTVCSGCSRFETSSYVLIAFVTVVAAAAAAAAAAAVAFHGNAGIFKVANGLFPKNAPHASKLPPMYSLYLLL